MGSLSACGAGGRRKRFVGLDKFKGGKSGKLDGEISCISEKACGTINVVKKQMTV